MRAAIGGTGIVWLRDAASVLRDRYYLLFHLSPGFLVFNCSPSFIALFRCPSCTETASCDSAEIRTHARKRLINDVGDQLKHRKLNIKQIIYRTLLLSQPSGRYPNLIPIAPLPELIASGSRGLCTRPDTSSVSLWVIAESSKCEIKGRQQIIVQWQEIYPGRQQTYNNRQSKWQFVPIEVTRGVHSVEAPCTDAACFLEKNVNENHGYLYESCVGRNKKAPLSLTNPRDACEKFARFT